MYKCKGGKLDRYGGGEVDRLEGRQPGTWMFIVDPMEGWMDGKDTPGEAKRSEENERKRKGRDKMKRRCNKPLD